MDVLSNSGGSRVLAVGRTCCAARTLLCRAVRLRWWWSLWNQFRAIGRRSTLSGDVDVRVCVWCWYSLAVAGRVRAKCRDRAAELCALIRYGTCTHCASQHQQLQQQQRRRCWLIILYAMLDEIRFNLWVWLASDAAYMKLVIASWCSPAAAAAESITELCQCQYVSRPGEIHATRHTPHLLWTHGDRA